MATISGSKFWIKFDTFSISSFVPFTRLDKIVFGLRGAILAANDSWSLSVRSWSDNGFSVIFIDNLKEKFTYLIIIS